MDLDNQNIMNNSSSGDSVIITLSPIQSAETPKRSTSKVRLSKTDSVSTMNE
jgi:hypothetical protein